VVVSAGEIRIIFIYSSNQKPKHMKNNLLLIGIIANILVSLLIGCQDSSTNYQSEGNYISGYVQYADTNFVTEGGYYAIALFPNRNSPFSCQPIKTQIIDKPWNIPKYYRMFWDGNDQYYLAVVWVNDTNEISCLKLQGALGCDTSRTCNDYHRVAFPNFTGNDYNIVYWADTAKKLN
jgi:hypothetical protein